ncbi:MAG: histidine kinase dimerization/phosphoacceptor domain -containing protein [Cyclobacteriaceae bacterium]
MKIRYFFGIVWLAILFSCIDNTIENDLEATSQEVQEIEYLYDVADTSYYDGDYLHAIKIYRRALTDARSISDLRLQSNLSNDIGLSFRFLTNYDSAIFYFQKALAIDLLRADTIRISGRIVNMATCYRQLGMTSKALNLFLEAKGLLKHYPKRANRINSALGNVYLQTEDYESALKYFQLQLENDDRTKIPSYLFNNIGYSFFRLVSYDSAAYYLKLALQVSDNDQGLINPLDNFGLLYIELGQLSTAEYYLDSSFRISSDLGMYYAMTDNQLVRARLYLKQGRNQQANDQVLEALYVARRINSVPLRMRAQEILMNLNLVETNYEKAFGFQAELMKLQEEVYKSERKKTDNVRYQFDLKEEQERTRIALREAELSELRSNQRFALSVALAVFLVFAVFVLVVIVRQRDLLKSVNAQLGEEKEKVEALNRQNFHFTKNSLAGVVAMLNKQIRLSEGQKIQQVLQQEKLRMETVNMLYNQAFQKGDGLISMKDFLTEIVENTINTFYENDEIHLINEFEDFYLSNDKAFSLGILLNEITVNACKYSLVNNPVFQVSSKWMNDIYVLEIWDQGSGFPKGFDWESSKSFGITLIRLFVDEIGGKLTIVSATNKGLNIKIEAPCEKETNHINR